MGGLARAWSLLLAGRSITTTIFFPWALHSFKPPLPSSASLRHSPLPYASPRPLPMLLLLPLLLLLVVVALLLRPPPQARPSPERP